MEADRELSWADLKECDIRRFRREGNKVYFDSGVDYYYINVLRKVFKSYPEDVRHGTVEPDPAHKSNVFLHELIEAEEKMKKWWMEQFELRRRTIQPHQNIDLPYSGK